MSLAEKIIAVAVLFTFALLTYSAVGVAQQKEEEVPFLYPDPRTVGVHPYVMQGKAPGPVTANRYAGVSEQERHLRILHDMCEQDIEGFPVQKYEQPPCPLCEENYQTPCGQCKLCLAGFPCERTLCRHCVQPRSKNMGNSCDLTAGDEPCGTCDACREHRSDPCEHADDGYGPRGEFNPYKEPRLLAVIPRPILDTYNNGARKFPVYYNPAPYYRPTWNPSLFAGYARPYTHRWSCALCFKDPCICDTPGLAGQISYAFTCKFCNRNPCACAAEICDVTKPMDPRGVAQALADMKEGTGGVQPMEIPETTSLPQSPTSGASDSDAPPIGGGTRVDILFDDGSPVIPEDTPTPPTSQPRPILEVPAPATPSTSESSTVS